MYFRVCPHCGCALDPSERCDCQQERRSKDVRMRDKFKPVCGRFFKRK